MTKKIFYFTPPTEFTEIYKCERCDKMVWKLSAMWINGRWMDLCQDCIEKGA